MVRLILPLLIVLTGCVPEEQEPCNTKYSYDDTMGATGLELKATSSPFITFSKMEAMYKDLELCLGVNAPGPTVEYRSFKASGLGGGWGVYMPANRLIWLNTDESIAPRNCHSDRETIRHEYVHHILYMNGKDYSHGSPEFERCGAFGVNTCNGVPCS